MACENELCLLKKSGLIEKSSYLFQIVASEVKSISEIQPAVIFFRVKHSIHWYTLLIPTFWTE